MLVCSNSSQPWSSTLPILVLLQKCKTSHDVNQVHARLITTGFINNPCLTTKIILTLSSSPHPKLIRFARYIFMSRHAFRYRRNRGDPFLWNAVIKSFSHGCDPKQAVFIFLLMLENGVCVDRFTFSLVLKACTRMGLIKEGIQIHGLLRKLKFGFDVFLMNCLICFYLRCGCLEYACQMFDLMPKRDSVSFNLMIDGYVKYGRVHLARKLFDCMAMEEKNLITWNSMISGYAQLKDGFEVAWELFEKMPERDLVSWNSMIDACVKGGKMEAAHILFSRMPKKDAVSWANIIDGYAKFCRVDIARGLFDRMPVRDVIAYNSMMAGYVQNGYCKEALEIFHNMKSETNLLPDNATLLIVLSAVAQLGRIDEGVAIHCYMGEHGFCLRGKLGVALIDMYSKCGSVDNAMWVFEDVEEKSIDHWNAMIGGLAIHGLGELAFELFMEMGRQGLKPDDITFIGVLNACGHSGLVKEGLMCFELMRRVYKVEPILQHYGCMVDILSRAGHIKEARKFITDMPVEPNDVIWRTFLSACKNYENYDLGEQGAKHMMEMDYCNSSSYVLLSNICATFGMWNNVSRVRTMMKERYLKKLPGCSWIVLKGVVHEFFVRDESHPQVGEIYSTLGSLCAPTVDIKV